jgi:lipoprotein-releasing system permease protein
VKDINRASTTALAVEKLFSPDQNVMAKDWFRMNKNLYSAMELEKKTMFIILTLIIIVAAFNIISILITMVKEKTKEIGVMKSLGFSSHDVYKVFLYFGLISGGTGVILGELLGLIICLIIKWSHINVLPADVYYSTELKVHLSVFNFVITGVLAFLITFLASVLPAKQASRMDAVEAIKYE